MNLYTRQYYRRFKFGFQSEKRADHKEILKLLKIKNKDQVLEIGCGFGVLLNKIPSMNKKGIEISQIALRECQKRGLTVVKADAEKGIPLKANTFDIVILNEVIEHFKNPKFVLDECFRVLRKKGRLVITTPVYHLLTKKMAGKESHFSEMTVCQIQTLINKTGFKILNHEVSGIFFLYPILELFLFKPFRFFQQKGIGIKTIDKGHQLADQTFLKPLACYRKRFLSWGQNQLILASKK